MPHAVIFLLGLGTAVALKVVGGSGVGRKAVKTVIKGGLLLSRRVQELAAEVTEDLQDVTAEASAEIDDVNAKAKEA